MLIGVLKNNCLSLALRAVQYLTPLHCQDMLDSLVTALNATHQKFLSHHPYFKVSPDRPALLGDAHCDVSKGCNVEPLLPQTHCCCKALPTLALYNVDSNLPEAWSAVFFQCAGSLVSFWLFQSDIYKCTSLAGDITGRRQAVNAASTV